MSQERVLTLLYDKTFPPRSQSVGFTGQLGQQFNTGNAGGMTAGNRNSNRAAARSAHKIGGMNNVDSMRKFNYFGNNPGQHQNVIDEDVEILEREIESVMMRKGGTAVGSTRDRLDQNIVNMTTTNFEGKRTFTANAPETSGRRRKIPKHGSTSKDMAVTSNGGSSFSGLMPKP